MINKKQIPLVIALVLAVNVFLFSQTNIKFENMSIVDGLSNSAVQTIIQDFEGFMWFGTVDGLNKYDGTNFTIYRDDSESLNTISGTLILKIYEDSHNNLWVATDQGLNLYNRDTDNFEVFQRDSNDTRVFFNGIFGIYEDSRSNLWIGKAYDGPSVFLRDSLKYKQIIIDSTVTPAGAIFAIWDYVEDSNGELWYTKGNNLNSPSELVKINQSKTKEILVNDLVKLTERQVGISPLLYKDPEDNLWFSTFDGFSIKYLPKNKSFEFHDLGENNVIYSSRMDKNGNMWYSSLGTGLFKYNPNTKSLLNFKVDVSNPQGISSNNNIAIYIDKTGIFWVGSGDKGVDKFDPFKEPFELFTISEGEGTEKEFDIITSFTKSLRDTNLVWIGTNKGLYTFNLKNKDIESVTKSRNFKLPEEISVRCLLEDGNNGLWLGTNSGAFRINLRTNKVEKFESDINDYKTLSHNVVRDLIQDDDKNIWIATQQGLNKYDPTFNSLKRFYFLDSAYTVEVRNFIDEKMKSENIISSIKQAEDNSDLSSSFTINEQNDYFVFTVGEMIAVQDGQLWDYGWIEDDAGRTVWYPDSLQLRHAGGAIKNKMYATIVNLSPGEYKLRYKSDDSHSYGNWNAAAPINPQYWGISIFKIDSDEKKFLAENLIKIEFGNSISSPNIRSLYTDKSGRIWIGTNNNGFSIYSPKTNSFNHYNAQINSVTGFTSDRINSFLENDDGSMWIATFGGLLFFNPEDESISQYTTKNGIPTNYVVNLLKDDNNNIWFSSQKGLTQFKPEENGIATSFVNYDMKDGLQGYQFSNRGSLKLNDGRLLFGGIKGFNMFLPGNINNLPPEVVVTQLLISNALITSDSKNTPLKKSISQTDYLNLSHDQNDISLEFTALHYARPDKNQYAHMLEGFDDDWIYDNRSFATYTNLDPGKYIFKVKASNSDGVWNDIGASITIDISAPWWSTIWAYLAYIIIAGSIVYSIDKGRKRKIIKTERERQRIQAAELRAKAAEAEARAIQAENERKTKELEEARTLQLSMLPKVLPELPHLDIAVYMKTATEVGGDYYDFHVSLDGTLTAVIGDATGHGLNAGTVVTVTKSLFNSHGSSPDILFTFNEISRCLKEMKFKYLSMCLMILKIKGNQLQISSAGMPPALIYRNSTKEVEEFLLKGMPLGAPASLPYELRETELNSGDTILLMSDGFPELINDEKKMFGYDTARLKFEDVADKQPEDIITYLKDEGSSYVNDDDPNDDVTFVVIKVK